MNYHHTSRAHKDGQPVDAALQLDYAEASADELGKAYTNVAKGLAVVEENPRGELGPVLRRHLNIIVEEQQKRGEAVV